MKEHDGVQPYPETDCGLTKSLLKDLWVDGCLSDGTLSDIGAFGPDEDGHGSGGRHGDRGAMRSGAPASAGAPRPERSVPSHSSTGASGLVDAAVLRHIEECSSCRREADELKRLGQSLEVGLQRLCGSIARTMDDDIEETLHRLREPSNEARLLRRIRRPVRFILWLTLLGFTLLASAVLAVAVYEALKGL